MYVVCFVFGCVGLIINEIISRFDISYFEITKTHYCNALVALEMKRASINIFAAVSEIVSVVTLGAYTNEASLRRYVDDEMMKLPILLCIENLEN